MKRIQLISFMLLSLGVKAQSEEKLLPQTHNLRLCFESSKSYGFHEKSIDIDRKVFNLITEQDSVGVNIIVSDKDELQKLGNRISYETFGTQEKLNRVAAWKSMDNLLFGSRISVEQVAMSYLQEGSFHLLCHGISDQKYNSMNRIVLDGNEIDAKSAAKIILRELEGYDIITKYSKRPLVVVIHACGVGGKSRCSFASRLSRYLAKKSPIIYVIAAPGNIHPSVNTWPSYTETVIDNKGIAVNWNCFHKGKFVSEGEKDFASTIIKIQNEYLK